MSIPSWLNSLSLAYIVTSAFVCLNSLMSFRYSDTVPLGGVDLLSPVWLENMDLIDLLLFVTGFAVVGPFLSLQRMRR